MEAIIGNKRLLEAFLSAIRENRVAGCYLIEGASGTGKRLIAKYVASALACPNRRDNGGPCLSCHSCRSIEADRHIDVFWLLPPEDKKNVTMEGTRQMLANLYIHPSEGDWRIFIIPHGEKLSTKIQNALLKSIEEPPENTVFLILTEDKSRLLPTVRSRAVHFRTEPLPSDEIRLALKKEGLQGEVLEEAVLLCAGSIGQARTIACDEAFHETRKKILDYFRCVSEGASFTGLSLIFPPSSTSRSDLERIFPLMKLALRDLICFRYEENSSPAFFTDLEFAKNLASMISPSKAVRLFRLTDEMTLRAAQNANVFSTLSEFHLEVKKLTRTR